MNITKVDKVLFLCMAVYITILDNIILNKLWYTYIIESINYYKKQHTYYNIYIYSLYSVQPKG